MSADGPVRLRITGEVALAEEELNSSLRGMEYAGIITFVMVVIVLYFAMRNAGLILNVLVCLTMGLLLTAAFATAEQSLNLSLSPLPFCTSLGSRPCTIFAPISAIRKRYAAG